MQVHQGFEEWSIALHPAPGYITISDVWLIGIYRVADRNGSWYAILEVRQPPPPQ